MSLGNWGGVSEGYFLSVQLYWPPRVIHRSFLSRKCWTDMGLCTSGSLGRNTRAESSLKKEFDLSLESVDGEELVVSASTACL